MEKKFAIITGADGGMGMEITRAVAEAGYSVIMACYRAQKAEAVCQQLIRETGNSSLEVWQIDLSSMDSVMNFVREIRKRRISVSLLMNNAGTMETGLHLSVDGWERTVSVNYMGPFLLTRQLLPLMERGASIVNMVSCTYAVGKLSFPDFFRQGKKGRFFRIPVYSNTKLALMLFTFELAERLQEKGITVNATDPGIVSTNIIRMHQWFDPLTDLFFRPFIRTPRQGASTAIHLLLTEKGSEVTGRLFVNGRPKELSDKYSDHVQRKQLWEETEGLLEKWL